MALQVTSTPVAVPTGIRLTVGTVNFNGATYAVGGNAVTVAQWGGGSNGIPNRLPDFVLFSAGTASDDGDGDFGTVFRYVASSGKVQTFGEEALVADQGLTEMDAEAASQTAQFLAIWLEAAPSTLA